MSEIAELCGNVVTPSNNDIASKAASWALSKIGCPYSQARRLKENVFDCSSLVARAYIAQGKKWFYGGPVPISSNEVYDDSFELLFPSAYAAIGNKFGGKNEIALATQPGDLQFACTDSSTTRSNKITHVAMVADKNHIVHARGTKYGVVQTSINTYSGKLVALVRYNPSCTLRLGMKGYRVQALQRSLNETGIGVAIDGHYAERTWDAVKDFQKSHGLPATGEADAATLAALMPDSSLNAGENTTTAQIDTIPTKVESAVTIIGSTVNLRTGPGTDYSVAGVVRKGDAFEALGTTEWMPILVDGKVLWISKKYVTTQPQQ